MTLEILLQLAELEPDQWIDFPEFGFRQYFLWKNPHTGASIAVLKYEKGGRIPIKHVHASNQFMYCLEGDYEYTDSKIRLRAGAFYMNPKDQLLQQESPLTTVYIRESNMDALLQEMRIGNIDLLCGTLPDKHLGLDIDEKVLTDDNTVIVVGPSHPLAGREQVAWCDLAGFPWVLPPSGSLLKTPLLAAIRRNGLSLPTVYVETLSPSPSTVVGGY
ncbi:hypothetical protein PSTG_18153 [Puccinia striiformis f. sp. tritici PST-78]|uniref:LysR substrate-binding domain-containing protein n=1 Tax=Puccinia striiformis f. sp. tritici PST-78 TaxID=1165861 RepID=A0A0L0UN93_9BASI|nr:hypothetical protein PSTG_18153 [Puccinia striiformis f. sp. tritici PST-78]